MASNIKTDPGGSSSAVLVATDDVSGVQFQRVKLDVGGAGASVPVVGTIPISGTVTTSTAVPTAGIDGNKLVAVTNTPVALAASSTPLTVGVIVQALAANAANVKVGFSSGAPTFELQPGQAMSAAIDNLTKLFVNGTAGDGVCFAGS